jgi:hypothetical protein
LKNHSTCQRHRYSSVIVKAGNVQLLVRTITGLPVARSLNRMRRSGAAKPVCE